MEKTIVTETAQRDGVAPRTLYSKPGKFYDVGAERMLDVTYVMGGTGGDHFVAMFADADEAAAWIAASNHFGQPVKAVKYGAARAGSGDLSEKADGASGGCSGETREPGNARGSGQGMLFP